MIGMSSRGPVGRTGSPSVIGSTPSIADGLSPSYGTELVDRTRTTQNRPGRRSAAGAVCRLALSGTSLVMRHTSAVIAELEARSVDLDPRPLIQVGVAVVAVRIRIEGAVR